MGALVGPTPALIAVICTKTTFRQQGEAVSRSLPQLLQPWEGEGSREDSKRVQPTSDPGLVVQKVHSEMEETKDPITEKQP